MSIDSTLESEQAARDVQLRAVVEHAIDALPDDVRVVFVLRVVEQLSSADAAECLGISAGAVTLRLRLAREQLSEHMQQALAAGLSQAYDRRSRCDRVVSAVMRRIAAQARDGRP